MDYNDILHVFETIRKKSNFHGPAMYIIAPYNGDIEDYQNDGVEAQIQGKWQPSVSSPEWVVLKRVIYLAKRSREYMLHCLVAFDDSDWSPIFRETPNSFKSYSLLMRVHQDFIVDPEASSTGVRFDRVMGQDRVDDSSFARSMQALSLGPKALRQKVYRNLRAGSNQVALPAWQPVCRLVEVLRKRFGRHAVFFYNQSCPEVICVLWRPHVFCPSPFSVMSCEHSYPIDEEWNSNTLVSRNLGDMVREMQAYSRDIVTNIRIFDESCLSHSSKRRRFDDMPEQASDSSDSSTFEH